MRTIRLNGELGKKYGRIHKLDVRTPAEGIRALCTNFPAFRQDLMDAAEKGLAYRCVVDRDAIGAEQLSHPMSRNFSVTPVVAGAGKVGTIILAVALIAFAVLNPAFALALPGTLGTITATTVTWIGVSMLLGGIAQLLAPTPKMNTPAEKTANNVFDGPVNVTAQGAPVPVGYGRMIVGSVVISAGITVQQPVTTYGVTGDLMMNGLSHP
jgi:hypothetical protein